MKNAQMYWDAKLSVVVIIILETYIWEIIREMMHFDTWINC